MNIIIREATPDDAEKFVAFMQQVTEEQGINIPIMPGEYKTTVEDQRKILGEFAASDNSVFLLAEDNGHIIGYIDCKGFKRQVLKHAVLIGMSVHKDWRGKGVGTMLMAHAIEWAKSTNIVKRMELSVYERNTPARHLYEKFGFQIEGMRKNLIYENGRYLDDVMMALLLP
jgi:ribosomal protein S18 acetylase RimI-like enzyme